MTEKDHRDLIGGALMTAIGLFAVVFGQQYDMGSAARTGPGLFPVALGALLALLGVAIAVPAWARRGEAIHIEWRAAAIVLGAVVVFAIALRPLGLIPATLLATFLSSLADRNMGWRGRIMLAITVTALTVLIFITGLEMILPLWWWAS